MLTFPPTTYRDVRALHNKLMVNHNTDYYRRNKTERFMVHKCPHCDFETTNSKVVIQNHIYAKHTPEHKRPHICFKCNKGFSQKSHLISHLKSKHNITSPVKNNKTVVEFHVSTTKKEGKSKKTVERLKLYEKHPIIYGKKMSEYLYLNDTLTSQKIYYDTKKGLITLKTYTAEALKN